MLDLGELKSDVAIVVAQCERVSCTKEKHQEDAHGPGNESRNSILVRTLVKKPYESAEGRDKNRQITEDFLFAVVQGLKECSVHAFQNIRRIIQQARASFTD